MEALCLKVAEVILYYEAYYFVDARNKQKQPQQNAAVFAM